MKITLITLGSVAWIYAILRPVFLYAELFLSSGITAIYTVVEWLPLLRQRGL